MKYYLIARTWKGEALEMTVRADDDEDAILKFREHLRYVADNTRDPIQSFLYSAVARFLYLDEFERIKLYPNGDGDGEPCFEIWV